MNRLNLLLTQDKNTPSRFKQKQSRIPIWSWLVGGGGFLLLWLVLVVSLYPGSQYHGTNANRYIEGLTLFSNPGREHRQDDDIKYDREVPMGGAHLASWLNCGIYDEPVSVEQVVHSLEHGVIWLAYQPDLPVDQISLLRNLVRQEQQRWGKPFLILAPKPGLDAPVMVTAWQMQLELDNASDKRLVQFLRRYHQGLFTPEPGADCTGGVGQPVN